MSKGMGGRCIIQSLLGQIPRQLVSLTQGMAKTGGSIPGTKNPSTLQAAIASWSLRTERPEASALALDAHSCTFEDKLGRRTAKQTATRAYP